MAKNIFIMGDSYSTYGGYIPEGYNFYYADERDVEPIVKGVEKTWWKRLATENNFNIVLNDSFSGSTICNTVRETLTVESSFISRIDKYIAENFFAENKIDTMFIFGGTNDSWIDAPLGEVKYSDWSDDELKCVLPAFCYLLNRAKSVAGKVMVIINTDLKEEITKGFIKACEENKVAYLCLDGIDKDNGHPTELGMKQISDQVAEKLNAVDKKSPDYLLLVNEENGVPVGFEDTVEIIDIDNGFGNIYGVERKTYEAFLLLKEDVLKNNGIRAEIIAGKRSIEAQEAIFRRYVDEHGPEYAKTYAAKPGHSEHHTGLAIDIGVVVDGKLFRSIEELLSVDELFKVIQSRAVEYGFILRYPKGKEAVTKIGYEPWHFRYIDSPEIAKEMADKGICFEEYWSRA